MISPRLEAAYFWVSFPLPYDYLFKLFGELELLGRINTFIVLVLCKVHWMKTQWYSHRSSSKLAWLAKELLNSSTFLKVHRSCSEFLSTWYRCLQISRVSALFIDLIFHFWPLQYDWNLLYLKWHWYRLFLYASTKSHETFPPSRALSLVAPH